MGQRPMNNSPPTSLQEGRQSRKSRTTNAFAKRTFVRLRTLIFVRFFSAGWFVTRRRPKRRRVRHPSLTVDERRWAAITRVRMRTNSVLQSVPSALQDAKRRAVERDVSSFGAPSPRRRANPDKAVATPTACARRRRRPHGNRRNRRSLRQLVKQACQHTWRYGKNTHQWEPLLWCSVDRGARLSSAVRW